MLKLTKFFDVYIKTYNLFDYMEKQWNYVIENTPKQDNNYDCGVFVCTFIDYLSRRETFDFKACDMMYFRALIGIELTKSEVIID